MGQKRTKRTEGWYSDNGHWMRSINDALSVRPENHTIWGDEAEPRPAYDMDRGHITQDLRGTNPGESFFDPIKD